LDNLKIVVTVHVGEDTLEAQQLP
jgi:hypothetical protein